MKDMFYMNVVMSKMDKGCKWKKDWIFRISRRPILTMIDESHIRVMLIYRCYRCYIIGV